MLEDLPRELEPAAVRLGARSRPAPAGCDDDAREFDLPTGGAGGTTEGARAERVVRPDRVAASSLPSEGEAFVDEATADEARDDRWPV